MNLIGQQLIPAFAFHPKSFNSVLNIVFADGFYFASVVQKSIAPSCGEHLSELQSNESLNVSKAAAKIREALLRISYNKSLEKRAEISGKVCIDVGASPGGWSYFLRTTLGASRVIAVDMGKLAEPIPEGVEHWRMKGEDAISQLLNSDAKNNQIINLYCCDMNCNPMDSVQLFLRALPLMAPGSGAVITLKRMERNAQRWLELKTACISVLTDNEAIQLVEEVHLIANTPNETTLLIALK
jgi:23S rRNA U2552 (ribose-2'-O)-methylase RlmE/FtsJ